MEGHDHHDPSLGGDLVRSEDGHDSVVHGVVTIWTVPEINTAVTKRSTLVTVLTLALGDEVMTHGTDRTAETNSGIRMVVVVYAGLNRCLVLCHLVQDGPGDAEPLHHRPQDFSGMPEVVGLDVGPGEELPEPLIGKAGEVLQGIDITMFKMPVPGEQREKLQGTLGFGEEKAREMDKVVPGTK